MRATAASSSHSTQPNGPLCVPAAVANMGDRPVRPGGWDIDGRRLASGRSGLVSLAPTIQQQLGQRSAANSTSGARKGVDGVTAVSHTMGDRKHLRSVPGADRTVTGIMLSEPTRAGIRERASNLGGGGRGRARCRGADRAFFAFRRR